MPDFPVEAISCRFSDGRFSEPINYNGETGNPYNKLIELLMQGPNNAELSKTIPEGTKVNKIVDYFDSRFELEAIGTGVDGATGEITGKLAENQYRELNGTYTGKNGENHTKLEIDVNKLISSSAEDTPASYQEK